MRHVICGLPRSTFFHITSNGTIFEKKVIDNKYFDFINKFLRRIERETIKNIY
jgi:hypothetical protein